MSIYTSYFSKATRLDKNKYDVVSITRYPPKWFHGMNIEIFAPSENLLWLYKNKHITDIEFTDIYYGELNRNKDKITDTINIINKYFDEKDLILCCYEKSDSLCHRHVLGRFLGENFDIEVKEIG